MNKKKSRKNKKRRDNDNKPGYTQSPSQFHSQSSFTKPKSKSNDKYLDNFNLSEHQQSAIKFLSEALSISSQEAHIICNECKWEQSEFPSTFEDAQSMLHWNKNNTKSKRKRDQQNRYKKQDQNKQKPMHHSPTHSPPKSTHKHQNPSSPKCTGFIPHKTYANVTPNTNMKPATPTKTKKQPQSEHSERYQSNATAKAKHNKTNVSNRCLIKSSSRINHANHKSMNSNANPLTPMSSKSMGYTRYRGRGRSRPMRGHPPYSSRGRGRAPGGRGGRGRGRGRANIHRNTERDKGVRIKVDINTRTRCLVSLSPPPGPTGSKSVEDSENTANSNNHHNMYLNHEALEQELRCNQQQHTITNKETDIESMKSNCNDDSQPQKNGESALIKTKEESKEQDAYEVDTHGSRRISPEKESRSHKMPAPITQEAFLRSHLTTEDSGGAGAGAGAHSHDEYKQQSFMFIPGQKTPQQENARQETTKGKKDTVEPNHKTIVDVEEKNGHIAPRVDLPPVPPECEYTFSDKYTELFQILNGVLIVGYSGDPKPPHLCMPFDRLLDLVNYQSEQVLSQNDLMEWYKRSKMKLMYEQHAPFTHQSTQTIVHQETEEEKQRITRVPLPLPLPLPLPGNGMKQSKEKEGRSTPIQAPPPVDRDTKQAVAMANKKAAIRKPTRPPMSAKYNLSLNQHHMQMNSNSVPNERESKRQQSMKQQPALNLNAKTFEPKPLSTKSRSSSRTKKDHEEKEKKSGSKSSTPRPKTASQIEIQQQIKSINVNLTSANQRAHVPPSNTYHPPQSQPHPQPQPQPHPHARHPQTRNRQPAPQIPQHIQQQHQQQQQQLMNSQPAPLFHTNPHIYKPSATQLFQTQQAATNEHPGMHRHYTPSYIVTNNQPPSNPLQHRILAAPGAHALHSLNALQGVAPLPPLTHQGSNASLPSLQQQSSVEFQLHRFAHANNPQPPPQPQPMQMQQHRTHHAHPHTHTHPHHHHHPQNGQILQTHNISHLRHHHPLLQ